MYRTWQSRHFVIQFTVARLAIDHVSLGSFLNFVCLNVSSERQRKRSVTFFMAQRPLEGQGVLIIEASRSHSGTPQSVELLWTSDQPDAETSTLQNTTLTTDRHPCHRRNSYPQSQLRSCRRPTP